MPWYISRSLPASIGSKVIYKTISGMKCGRVKYFSERLGAFVVSTDRNHSALVLPGDIIITKRK